MTATTTEEIFQLRKQIEELKTENAQLKKTNAEIQNEKALPLSISEYSRYGRQMICDVTNGVKGQLKLKNSKVLFIGAGGLACPALAYLAGAGVGTIGIVDDDVVENSNLHRQILHSSAKVGMLKCESAREFLTSLNPHIKIVTHPVRLSNDNAFEIFAKYDIILDCTDTPITRYLVSDVAVNLGKMVVSASGVQTEGQLCILNFKNIGPCYRCFYPTPPPPHAVSSCSAGGVIGPCIGLVGVMMAIETMKIILDVYTIENFKPFLLQYNGFPEQSLRNFKMRGRQAKCQSCGDTKTIDRTAIESGKINYFAFCGSKNYNVVSPEERMTVHEFETKYWNNNKKPRDSYVLLDVRPTHHYEISHLENTHNIALKDLQNLKGDMTKLQSKIKSISETSEVVVMCRHGNESRTATRLLKDEFGVANTKDVIGGFFKYVDEINPQLPKY